MLTAIEYVFWIACFLVVYPFVGYPLVLRLVNGGKAGNEGVVEHTTTEPIELPHVTMIVSAFNEEAVIEEKLLNSLSLDYPHERFEVIVVSDASTDRTASIVAGMADSDSRIRLVVLETQSGKSIGLNSAVPASHGEIIVFSDANAIYDNDALRKLVEPFQDPAVGFAVGAALYRDEDVEDVNVSEGLYWKFEQWIKQEESAFYSVVGGDGAIYAIRRTLFTPLAKTDISDFANPLQIVAEGYRGVFLPDARSLEHGTAAFSDEFRRKRRIVNRSWGAVIAHGHRFSPRVHARFLFMLVSHKVIRWFGCLFVAIALTCGAVLSVARDSAFYDILFIGILATVLFAVLGWVLDRRDRSMPKPVYLLFYFYLVAAAGLMGIIDYHRGRRHSVWSPSR